jgi:hypothetical protein
MSILLRNLDKKSINLESISTGAHNEFSELENDRRDWVVGDIEKATIKDINVKRCLSKIIALGLNLELPVGAFLSALLEREKEIPPYAIPGIIKNIQDEEKHFDAFNKLNIAYPAIGEHLEQATKFRKQVVSSKAHPLIKARDLETIVFVPVQTYLRLYGSDSVERIIMHISHDEYRHLQYGWQITEILGLDFDREFEKIAVGISKWVFEDIKEAEYDCHFWNSVINDMKEYGESKQLTDIISWGVTLPLFEISNSNY